MIKLIEALALARDGVDRAILIGEAIPRLERLKTIALCGLAVACVLLAIGYIHLNNDIGQIRSHQKNAQQARAEIMAYLRAADQDNARILRELAGK